GSTVACRETHLGIWTVIASRLFVAQLATASGEGIVEPVSYDITALGWVVENTNEAVTMRRIFCAACCAIGGDEFYSARYTITDCPTCAASSCTTPGFCSATGCANDVVASGTSVTCSATSCCSAAPCVISSRANARLASLPSATGGCTVAAVVQISLHVDTCGCARGSPGDGAFHTSMFDIVVVDRMILGT